MTFRDAVNEFKSMYGNSFGNYWEMQEAWMMYVDDLVRDGQVGQRQAYNWGNPCTPKTFRRWVGSSRRINSMARGYLKPVKSSTSVSGFDDWSSFLSYTEAHYLPLLDKISEEGYQITRDDARLLGFLMDDIVSMVNNYSED